MNNNDVVIYFNKVSKGYGNHMVLHNFDMTITNGEMVCIAGESGSGKSTILNMIGMFDRPDNGEIILFGDIIPDINSRLGKKYLRSKILYLFQNYALVEEKSIDYNLEIPLLNKTISRNVKREKKLQALKNVGLDKPLKTKIYQLSGGEQQRVALARGYLKEFDLILADEPTGSLDANNRDTVISTLRSFNKEGKTILVVSHDPFIMKACDRAVIIGQRKEV